MSEKIQTPINQEKRKSEIPGNHKKRNSEIPVNPKKKNSQIPVNWPEKEKFRKPQNQDNSIKNDNIQMIRNHTVNKTITPE